MKAPNLKNSQNAMMHRNDDSKAEKAFLESLELAPDADFEQLFRKIKGHFMPAWTLRQLFVDEHTEGRAFTAYLWLKSQDLSQLSSQYNYIDEKGIRNVNSLLNKVKKVLPE